MTSSKPEIIDVESEVVSEQPNYGWFRIVERKTNHWFWNEFEPVQIEPVTFP